jgi:lysophospholipase L1-like esterase
VITRRSWAILAVVVVGAVAGQQVTARYWRMPHDWLMYQLHVPVFSRAITDDIDALVRAERETGPVAEVWLGDSLAEDLDCHEINPSCLNLSVAGDTVFGVRHRVDTHRSVAGAKTVYVAVGHNDLGRTHNIAYITSLYEQILATIPPGPTVVCHAVLPVDERATHKRDNKTIAALNQGLREVCGRRPRARYLDLTAAFVDATGNLSRELHTGDGVHLTPAGYARWQAALRESYRPPPALPRPVTGVAAPPRPPRTVGRSSTEGAALRR